MKKPIPIIKNNRNTWKRSIQGDGFETVIARRSTITKRMYVAKLPTSVYCTYIKSFDIGVLKEAKLKANQIDFIHLNKIPDEN